MRLLLLLYALALSACSVTPPRLQDPSHWQAHRIDFGTQALEVRIPPGLNREFLDEPIPQSVDLSRPGLFDRIGFGPQLLSRHWEYCAGLTALPDGMLSATIVVRHSATPLDGLDSLEKAVAEGLSLWAAEQYAKSGKPSTTDRIVKTDVVEIAGRRGLHVRYSASPSNYVVLLDSSNYLAIAVDYAGFTKAEWENDARKTARAILEGIRIVGAK